VQNGFSLAETEAFRQLHKCYPQKRLYGLLDNPHNVHDHPKFLALLRKLHSHPAWTPTEASWLNLIEAPFGVLKGSRSTTLMIPIMKAGSIESMPTSGIDTAAWGIPATR
jgi:hypothetical protein